MKSRVPPQLASRVLSRATIAIVGLVGALGLLMAVPPQSACAQDGADMECGIACGIAGGEMISAGIPPLKVREWIDWCRTEQCGWPNV